MDKVFYVSMAALGLVTAAYAVPFFMGPGDARINPADIQDDLFAVVDRHYTYAVAALPTDTLDRPHGKWLNQADYAVSIFYAAKETGGLNSTFTAHLTPVLTRHDDWVRTDPTLTPAEQAEFLGQTQRLRRLFPPPEI